MSNKQQPKCTLSNQELVAKCKEWISRLCKSGGKDWTLRVPVDFNHDPDILFNELADRLTNQGTDKPKEEELSQPQTSMRWVKASERLPRIKKSYHIEYEVFTEHQDIEIYGGWVYFNGKVFDGFREDEMDTIKWLSESQEELTSPQKGDKEIAELAKQILKKHGQYSVANCNDNVIRAMVEIYKAAK